MTERIRASGDVRGAYRALGLHGPAFMTGVAADHLRAGPLVSM